MLFFVAGLAGIAGLGTDASGSIFVASSFSGGGSLRIGVGDDGLVSTFFFQHLVRAGLG